MKTIQFASSGAKPVCTAGTFALALRRLIPRILILLSITTFAAHSKAQLLTETFTYPDAALVGAAGSPWVTNTGTAGSLVVSGGAVLINDNSTEDAQAPLSSIVVSGSISGTFDLRVDPADIPNSSGGFIVHFRNSSNAFIGRVFTLAPIAGDAAGSFRLGLSTNTTASNASFSTAFTSGTTYSLTLDYDFATDLATLSVAGVGSITATDTFDTANINSFGLRQTTSTGDVFIDNLVVIPEPSVFVALLSGIGLLAMHRRRNR